MKKNTTKKIKVEKGTCKIGDLLNKSIIIEFSEPWSECIEVQGGMGMVRWVTFQYAILK